MTNHPTPLNEAMEKTRETARQLTGLAPGWAFWCLHVHGRVVPAEDGYRHPFSGGRRSSAPPEEHFERVAEAYFGKRPFNTKGRRALTIIVTGNRPLEALRRLRQILRNPRRYADHQIYPRKVELHRQDGWPAPFRFD